MSKTNFFISSMQNLSLTETTNIFVRNLNDFERHFALLYTPRKCFFAIVDSNNKFRNEKNEEINVSEEAIFEARVFNEAAELRWINETNGIGKAAILYENSMNQFFSADSKSFQVISEELITTINQSYLLWGKKYGNTTNGWTQFAEARIGAFHVPKEISTDYAQFTTVEYLKEFEDGNVAVIDERLTGISEVK